MIRTHRFLWASFLSGVAMFAAPVAGADQAPEPKEAPAPAAGAVENAANSASQAADKAKQSAGNAADKAAQSASSAADKAKQSAGNAADKASQSASSAADKAAGRAGQAADRATNAANNGANQAENAANRAANQAGQAADRASGSLDKAANQAGQAADRATNAAQNAAHNAANQAGNAADRATNAASQAADRAGNAANNAANRAGNTASQAGQALDRAANQAGNAANSAANRAGQAVNNAANQAGQAIDQARDAAGRVINNQTDVNARTNVNAGANVNAGSNLSVQGATGVQTQVLNRVFTGLGLGWTAGANALTLATLAPNGPFAQVGLLPGDQLVSIGGQRLATQADFVRYLYGVPVGRQIPLVVMRNGVQQTLQWTPNPQFISTLPPRQEVFASFAPQGQGGMSLGIRLDESVQDAAVVADVAAGSPAERAGVRAGDAIVALNQQRIDNPNDFVAAADQIQAGAPVRMSISRMMDVELAAGQTTVVNRPIAQPAPAVVTPVPRAAGRRFFRNR